jgi:hypothetical protein
MTSSRNIDFKSIIEHRRREEKESRSADARIIDEQFMVKLRCGAAHQPGLFRELSTADYTQLQETSQNFCVMSLLTRPIARNFKTVLNKDFISHYCVKLCQILF